MRMYLLSRYARKGAVCLMLDFYPSLSFVPSEKVNECDQKNATSHTADQSMAP